MFHITEPATAVATYRIGRKVGVKRNVFVFNLGDGTLDISVLTKMDLEGKSVRRHTYRGGGDLDHQMVFHFIGEVKPKHKENLSESRRAVGHLKCRVHALPAPTCQDEAVPSSKESASTFPLAMPSWNKANATLFFSSLDPVREALYKASLDTLQIQGVIVVVGSSPRIQRFHTSSGWLRQAENKQ